MKLFNINLVLFAIVSAKLFCAVGIEPYVLKLEKEVEGQLQAKLDRYLGEDKKTIAVVRLNAKTVSPEISNYNPGNKGVDAGYLPLPLIRETERSNFPPDFSAFQKNIRIESAEVTLRFPAETDSKLIQSAKELTQDFFGAISTKVSIKQGYSSLANSDGKNSRELTSQKPQPLLETLKPFSISLGLLFGALLLLAGIVFTALKLNDSSRNLASGIKDAAGNVATKQKNNEDIAPSKVKAKENITSESSRNKNHSELIKMRVLENIRFLNDTLLENPYRVIQCLGLGNEDLKGIRWLLPSLGQTQKEMFGRYFGELNLQKLMRKPTEERTASNKENFTDWLQLLTEKVILKQMSAGSVIEKVIPQEKLNQLYQTPPEKILSLAETSSNRGIWRVLVEIIKLSGKTKIYNQMNSDNWLYLADAVNATETELQEAAEEILSLQTNHENTGNLEYLEDFLIEPFASSVLAKPLQEQDTFLQSFEQSIPNLINLVGNRLWTHRKLSLIPKEVFSNELRKLNVTEKTMLVAGLPKFQSELVLRHITHSSQKTIVGDGAKRIKSSNNIEEMQNARLFCEQFIELLRSSEKAGVFKLEQETKEDYEGAA